METNVKRVLFFIGATVVNVLLILIMFITLSLILKKPLNSGENSEAIIIFILIGSVIGSFIVYNVLLKWFNKKWNLESLLGRSLFGKKRD